MTLEHQIFFAPISDLSLNGNFNKTVIIGINDKKLWGIICAEKTWKNIQVNDKVLFYHKGKILYSAHVKRKFEDKELSKELWGYKEKNGSRLYWEKIIEFSKVKNTEIDYDIFKEMADYKKSASVRFFFQFSNTVILENASKIEKLDL